eukprot:2822652-Prymnesium_polylepis.1
MRAGGGMRAEEGCAGDEGTSGGARSARAASCGGGVAPGNLAALGALVELLHELVRDAHRVLADLAPLLRARREAALEAARGCVVPARVGAAGAWRELTGGATARRVGVAGWPAAHQCHEDGSGVLSRKATRSSLVARRSCGGGAAPTTR